MSVPQKPKHWQLGDLDDVELLPACKMGISEVPETSTRFLQPDTVKITDSSIIPDRGERLYPVAQIMICMTVNKLRTEHLRGSLPHHCGLRKGLVSYDCPFHSAGCLYDLRRLLGLDF